MPAAMPTFPSMPHAPQPGPGARLVVGVALHGAGPAPTVLAARRHEPDAWELPGGKVEPGESPAQAAVREIGEELGCRIEVTGWLPGTEVIRPGLELAVAHGRVVAGTPRPRTGEHVELRWVAPAELAELTWLPPDVPFVLQLAAAAGPAVAVTALLDEREHADEVAHRLERAGYAAEVVRGRFHGEDDEDDQPWVVTTEAPYAAVELVVEEFDGWVEEVEETAPAPPAAPLPLPDAPRRVKGHWRE